MFCLKICNRGCPIISKTKKLTHTAFELQDAPQQNQRAFPLQELGVLSTHGMLLWKWEGKNSVRKAARGLELTSEHRNVILSFHVN